MYLTISKGQVWHGDLCNTAKDGHLYWVDTTIVPFMKNGKPINYIAIRNDITERKSTEMELLQAKEAAETAVAAKSEFLVSMSHEIRTPMNGVLGMLGLLLKTDLTEDQKRKTSIAQSSAESLLSIINDVLDFSKVDAGKLELEILHFNLRSYLGDFAEAMALRAQEKGLELVLDVTNINESMVRGDPGRMRQVLWTGFIAALLSFSIAGIVIYRVTENLIATATLVAHTYEVESLFEAAISHLDEAETGQRGYLLTDEISYLEPYENSKSKVHSILTSAKILTVDNPAQQQRISEIMVLADKKLLELKETIDLHRAGKRVDALDIILTDRGKNLMDRIRIILRDMKDEEQRLLAERRQESKAAIQIATLVTSAGIALTLLVFGAIAVFIGRDTHKYITGRDQTEKLLLRNSPDSTFVSRIDNFRFVDVNQRACTSYGYTRAEFLKMDIFDIEVKIPAKNQLRNLYDKTAIGEIIEIYGENKRKDGTTFSVHVRFCKLDNQLAVANVRDISEQKLLDDELERLVVDRTQELRLSETKVRLLLESTSQSLYELDTEGKCTFCNPACVRILGYKSETDLLGNNMHDLIHYKRIDGSEYPSDECRIYQAFRNNEATHVEDEVLWRSDGSSFPVEYWSHPIRQKGEVVGAVVTFLDITERKRLQEEQKEFDRELQEVQKLESLGVLAGGIAHDFNNILMAIMGNTELARMELSPMSPIVSRLDLITSLSKRAADLCRQMLAYSGKGRFVLENVNLTHMVEEMFHLLEVSISKKVVLKCYFADNLPSIVADATQIGQVIMNLITNASEAIGKTSGVISINVGAMKCSQNYLSETYLSDNLAEGIYVYFEVADTGSGMDSDTQEKLFEPFYTTKFTGRGLGLSAVLGIVRGHGGAIKLYSELGVGTTIKVLFPAAEQSLSDSVEADRQTKSWQGTGTILLVDDEESVLAVTGELLQKKGFKVLTAKDGLECIEVFKRSSEEIVCVLLDLTMPRMDGDAAYRELRRIKEDVNVILCSGYNQQDVTTRFAGKGLAGFMQKPYDASELFAKLYESLHKHQEEIG